MLYYLSLGVTASGLSYVAGVMFNSLIEQLGLFDDHTSPAPPPPSLFRDLSSGKPAWASYWNSLSGKAPGFDGNFALYLLLVMINEEPGSILPTANSWTKDFVVSFACFPSLLSVMSNYVSFLHGFVKVLSRGLYSESKLNKWCEITGSCGDVNGC